MMGKGCGWGSCAITLRRMKLLGTKKGEVVDGHCHGFSMRNAKIEGMYIFSLEVWWMDDDDDDCSNCGK